MTSSEHQSAVVVPACPQVLSSVLHFAPAAHAPVAVAAVLAVAEIDVTFINVLAADDAAASLFTCLETTERA